ncbi:MAG: hypothetical protein ABJL72_16540 [Roseobacter sp.]
MGDTLVDQLLSAMASFQATITRQHKEQLFEQRKEQTAQLKTVVVELDQSVFAFRSRVRELTDDTGLSDSQKVYQIRDLLDTSAPSNFDRLKSGLLENSTERVWYDLLERGSRRL